MIRTVTVTNYLGERLEMPLERPEKSGFIIKKIEGLGPVKATVNTSEVSTTDGAIYNSARLNQRNIVLTLGFWGNPSVEDVRQKSYKYFPIKKKVTLLIETDNRIAETDGYVESNEPDIFSKEEGAVISVICPNSYFRAAGQVNSTVFYGVEPAFEFPFSNESITDPLLECSTLRVEYEQTVFYNGDAEVGVSIRIHAIGEVQQISIYNVTTRGVMRIDTDKLESLTGQGITAGDEIIIETTKGEKSILLLRGGVYINILNCLNRNPEWFQLSKGDNIFAYRAEEGMSNLEFRIDNITVYEGV